MVTQPLLTIPDYIHLFLADIPVLNGDNWPSFKMDMEVIFSGVLAQYLLGATSSTTIPPECSLLNTQLFSIILDKVDIIYISWIDDSSSALQAWLALCYLHDPQPVVIPPQPLDTTPIPDDSYATVRTSLEDLTPIIPFSPSVIPSSTSPFIPFFNSYSAGPVHASKKHYTLSTLYGFKKHIAAIPSPSEDFQYEVYLYCAKWLVQVPGPGPPLPMDILKTPSTLLGFSGSICLSFFSFLLFQ